MVANKIGNAIKVGRSSMLCNRVMRGGQQVWPMAYTAQLFVSWVYGGQYALDSVPAGGGSAVPTWTLKVYRVSDGAEVYSTNVIPTVTLSTYSGFGFSNNTWTASSRGRNGDAASGTSAPTSVSTPRTCDLTASYTGTYNNVRISATKTVTMSQLKNEVHGGAYSNIVVTLSKYKTTGSPAPAYETTDATITATMDQAYTYDSGESYTYQQALKTNSFNLSAGDSWVTFPSISASGATVKVGSRGTTYDSNRRSTTIRATLGMSPSTYAEVTIYQAPNTIIDTQYNYYDFDLWTSPSSLGSTDTSFSVYGTLYYKYRNQYSSQEWGGWSTTQTTTVTPTITGAKKNGSNYTNYSGNTVTIPQNTGGSDIEYEATASYTDPAGYTWRNYTASVTQSGISYTYGTPVISFYYPEIPASGGTVYPVVSFSQQRTSSLGVTDTITGTLTQGATSGYASDGSYFSVSFYGSSASPGTFYSSDGRVYIGTRGTDPGAARNAATNCRCYIACHGQGAYSSYTTATQEANIETVTPASNVCSALSLTLSPSTLTAASTNVAVTAKASGTSTTERKDYTSGEHTGGVVTNYSNQTVTLESLKVNGTAQSSVSGFTASNVHNLSTKSYSVEGVYGGKTATTGITQAADIQSDWLTRDYLVSVSIGSNNVSAAGGQASISASGSHTKYKKWLSDNTDVSGSVSSVTDTPTLSLINISSSGVFWLDGTTLKHRDMTNNATTDSVKVRATNGSVTADSSTVSATNAKHYGTVTVTPSQSTIAASGTISGYPITFAAKSVVTWDSGYSESDYTNFSFSIRSKGNGTHRTYTLDSSGLTVGSLGTYVNSNNAYTYIKATPADSSVGNGECILTEAKNIIESTVLSVDWRLPSGFTNISSVGGSVEVTIGTNNVKVNTYSSGSTANESVQRLSVISALTMSGDSDFSMSKSLTTYKATISAYYNPSYTTDRSCRLTVTISGLTDYIDITQKHVFFHEYVTNPTSGDPYIRAKIDNVDSAQHTFGYTVAWKINGGDWQTRSATQTISGGGSFTAQTVPSGTGNYAQIEVTSQDGATLIKRTS